jgi:hypothetical protein
MKNLVIYFDGILQNADDIDGTKSASFTFRSKDNGGDSAFSFSPELTLYHGAFAYVRAKIIDAPLPALEQIKVLIYDECCAGDDGQPLLLFDGKIEGSDVNWCELPCDSCSVSVIDNSNDGQAIACLKNTIIWAQKPKFDGSGLSAGEDAGRAAPHTAYCIDVRPNFMQEIFMVLGFLFIVVLVPVIFVVATIVTVINVIISVVNFLGGNIPLIGDDISFYDEAVELVNLLQSLVVGCGFKHKTPFVHSYLRNLCDVCGLGLQSSIFGPTGDYYNTMQLDAPYVPGGKKLAKIEKNWNKNKPNTNGLQYLENWKQFNMGWRVSNGVLILEREDYSFGGIWFDLANIPNENIISLCFGVTEEKPAAYGEYTYSKDGIDNTGDEVVNGWSDIVFDWNVPVNPAQSGLKETNLFFGAAQFREDSNREDVSALDKPFYNTIFPILNDYKGALLIEKGVCNFPKLLIYDASSPTDSARVQRYQSTVVDTFDYNVNWWIKSDYIDGMGVVRDTAYQTLFQIDDPRATGIKTRQYTLAIVATCELVRTMSVDKFIRVPIGGVYYQATVEEIEYDTNSYLLTIQGKI